MTSRADARRAERCHVCGHRWSRHRQATLLRYELACKARGCSCHVLPRC